MLRHLLPVLLLASCGAQLEPATRVERSADFAEVETILREELDPGYPVRIVRECPDGGDDFGCSSWDDDAGEFVMHVYDGPSEADDWLEAETLRHEWAHLLVWDACQESDHGPLWGVAYARVYEATLP